MKYYKTVLDRYGEEGEDTQVFCISTDKILANIITKYAASQRGGKYEVAIHEFEMRAENLKEVHVLVVKDRAPKSVPLDYHNVLSFQYQYHEEAWKAISDGVIPMREVIELKPKTVYQTLPYNVACAYFHKGKHWLTDEEKGYILKLFPEIENDEVEELK